VANEAAMWQGQNVSEMSREDLERAFVVLGRLYRDTLSTAGEMLADLQKHHNDARRHRGCL
jgi:hypothetical protein